MAGIDFSQTTFDHRCMLVLVQPVGNIPRQQFQRIYTLLRSRYQRVSLPNANRVVRLKFVQNVHAHESRIWGTLHMHKHVLGLFCIGDLTKTNDQFAQLNQKFQDTLTQYSETLFDSRFIIMTDQSLPDQTEAIVINLQNYQHVLSTAIPEFGASLFWILDSKRVEKLNEKPDKMTMLKISLENDSGSQDDRTDSNRNVFDVYQSGYKKKCAGRNKKRLGDLCLLANLSYDALSHYAAAVDGLRSANDLLWLASALEGICAATIICKSGDYVLTPGSAAVLPEGKGRRSPSFNAVATKDDNAVATVPSLNANLLSTNDVIERYLEAIKIYNRINVAPLIELEANIKLANVLASADKKVETSETLMRILYTNYPLSEEQKIQRYCFVSHIYEKINFGRKAAFISRIASMQCLSRNITNHPWIAVYSLMKKALKGYNLHPDFQLCAKDRSGWPALQLHVLKELIMCSRHLNDPAIASRLLIFILQFMDSSLSDSDKQTYCALLEMQSKNITGSPYQFTFNRNYGSQPMAMTMFPCIIQFTIVPLPTQLRPVKMLANTDSDNQNCFIFSALQKRSTKGKTDEIPITIQNETLRVEIKLVNPMPLEVKVSKMTLLVDDIAFDPHPAAIALPPKSEPVSMMLTGIPCSKGKLHILGYSSQVFGLNSLCTSTFCNESLRREIDVIPALPLIRISSTLSPGFVVTTSNEIQTLVTNLTTYTGERNPFDMIFENVSCIDVNFLNLQVVNSSSNSGATLFDWCNEDLEHKLPCQQRKTIKLPIALNIPYNDIAAVTDVNTEKITSALKCTYSGGIIHNEYCRQIEAVFNITIKPSVRILNFDVLSDDSCNECLIVFDVENLTTFSIEFYWTVTKTGKPTHVLIPKGAARRVAISIEKIEIAKVSNQENLLKEKLYLKKLSDAIELRWRIRSCGKSGIVQLNSNHLTLGMIDRITLAPVKIDVHVNDKPISSEVQDSFTVGSTVSVKAVITNISGSPLQNLCITIESYQDYENGYYDTQLLDKCAVVGTEHLVVPELKIAQTIEQECHIVFFGAGKYCLDVSCIQFAESSFLNNNLYDLSDIDKKSQSVNIYSHQTTKDTKNSLVKIEAKDSITSNSKYTDSTISSAKAKIDSNFGSGKTSAKIFQQNPTYKVWSFKSNIAMIVVMPN